MNDLNLVGKTLGSYQIVEEIGRGGMAVVYRAYQPSLNRDVAIKVLPPQLTFDQRFVERFQREARAAAGLRHPHIIVVHDVGEHDGLYYIVMEYLEGQTLRQLVEREGPLAPDRAARMVEQVASALDYAHQRGFVHRDVKPSNIFVREGDQTTLTDFGIAKAARGTQLTGTGMLIGTPEYMSPEQAQGEEVGPSTDIYALGVMAYQMLTGRVPFRGTTPHATLHAVIYQPPVSPRQINPRLSPAIESVLLKALAKQPEARFRTGAEMAAALQRAGSGEGVTVPPAGEVWSGPARTQRLRPRSLVLAIAAVAVVLVGLVGVLLGAGGGGGGPEATATASPGAATTVALPSEDRTATALAADPPQATDSPTPEPTPTQPADTPGPTATATQPQPTDTPGPTATATPMPPTDTPEPTATSIPMPPTDTPMPTAPPTPTATEVAGGGQIGFVSDRTGNDEIYVMNVDGSGLKKLTDVAAADWGPAWSPDGGRIAFASERDGNWEIYTMRADGSGPSRLTNNGAYDSTPSWSPNGQRITFMSDRDGNLEIYALNAAGGGVTRLTNHPELDVLPSWSPAGGRIAFQSGRDGNGEIYVMNADGSGLANLTRHPASDWGPAWSPDGGRIAFASDRDGNWEIYTMQADGSGLARLTQNGADDQSPVWSPDGRRIAFMSRRDGNSEIYVMNADGSNQTRLTNSPGRDESPSWVRP